MRASQRPNIDEIAEHPWLKRALSINNKTIFSHRKAMSYPTPYKFNLVR